MRLVQKALTANFDELGSYLEHNIVECFSEYDPAFKTGLQYLRTGDRAWMKRHVRHFMVSGGRAAWEITAAKKLRHKYGLPLPLVADGEPIVPEEWAGLTDVELARKVLWMIFFSHNDFRESLHLANQEAYSARVGGIKV